MPNLAEEVQPSGALRIVTIDGLAPITTQGNVVQPTGEPDAKASGHPPSLVSRCCIARPYLF
jgi:hypothetical protein